MSKIIIIIIIIIIIKQNGWHSLPYRIALHKVSLKALASSRSFAVYYILQF